MDGLDNYVCSCTAGFSGDHCETGIPYEQVVIWRIF